MAKKTKKPKVKRDEKGRIVLSKSPKQPKADAEKMTLKERILRIEIALGIVEIKS